MAASPQAPPAADHPRADRARRPKGPPPHNRGPARPVGPGLANRPPRVGRRSPELNPLRSGVGTGRPPRSPQQQRKSTAQAPTGRPAHPHSPRPQTENREQGCEKKDPMPHPTRSNVVLVCVVLRCFKTGVL